MSAPDSHLGQRHVEDEPPPVLRSWPRLYGFVCGYLFAVIVAFYWFTQSFAP